MGKFKLIETTADIGVTASGESLREVFTHTAIGLFSIMGEIKRVEKKISFPFSVKGDNLESLLINWLNELIYLQEVNDLLGREVMIEEIDSQGLKGKLWGEKIDRKKHQLGTEVKAATYHNLEIKNKNGGWVVRVIFDI